MKLLLLKKDNTETTEIMNYFTVAMFYQVWGFYLNWNESYK